MTKLIYLASPYSHSDAEVRQDRYEQVCQAAAELISQGLMVYSPIAHSHGITLRMDRQDGFQYWQEFDFRMIAHCDEFWVRRLNGWKESEGVHQELKHAEALGKPRIYI